MENKLPKNWVECRLGELATVQSGGTPSRSIKDYWDGNIPWVKISDIKEMYVESTTEFISEDGLKNSSARIFPKGTILFTIFATLGKIGILNIDAATNQAIAGITPSDFINDKYLTYSLIDLSNSISENGKGVAQKNINQAILKDTLIPLPPLAEQNRIVAKLDTLFAQLEQMKSCLANIPVLLKNFRQQVLTQAVTGKLTEEWRKGKELEEWREVELGEICSLKAGKFISASEISNEKQDGYFPCYGANGLRGYVESFTHNGRYSLIGRQGALCGNVHLIEGQFHATEHALVVNPLTNIDDIWLFFKLTSLELINYAKGVAQPGLSVMNLTPILIEVPPLLEQREIVTRVKGLFAKADAIEQQYQSLKAKIEALPQALLHKAFKGELVPQLPTDGDAKDLLEEIKKLKGSLGKNK
ncbi:MAG: type site-specific deoxyribonuclease [Bacteroidota bacterium]|jgi:type I restriction enzyme S subunit